MFKYPLAVTIDTNIFDAARFDLCDTSTLKILENYVKSGKIKVVLEIANIAKNCAGMNTEYIKKDKTITCPAFSSKVAARKSQQQSVFTLKNLSNY